MESNTEFINSIPAQIKTSIESIQKATNMPLDFIMNEYKEIFMDSAVQNDGQFKTDADKHNYSVMVLHNRRIARGKTTPQTFLAFGIESVRKTRSGLQSALVIAMPTKDGGYEIRRIIGRGGYALFYQKVNLGNVYKDVDLGSFGKNSKDFSVDERAKFANPIIPPKDMSAYIENFGIIRTNLNQMKNNLSKKVTSATGSFVDSTDLRVIRGMIIGDPRINERDGIKKSVFNISDMSVDLAKPIGPDGQPVQTSMAIWIAPELAVYGSNSQVDAIGTLTINKNTNEVLMNGICLIPIIKRPISVAQETPQTPAPTPEQSSVQPPSNPIAAFA